jgi:hypothetical protein
MIDIKKVTLVTVDGVDPEKATKILQYSCRDILFEDIKVITFKEPSNLSDNIKFIKINKLDRDGYNRFIAKDLFKYINTDFCITVQLDGFILNANMWSEEFLNYDYIGAPWPTDLIDAVLANKYQRPPIGHPWIGNGGFSLRSRRILEEASKFSWPGGGEDNLFCIDLRDHMESIGLKYAPIDLSLKFSMETPLVEGIDRHLLPIDFSKHFGFHGLYPYLWELIK